MQGAHTEPDSVEVAVEFLGLFLSFVQNSL